MKIVCKCQCCVDFMQVAERGRGEVQINLTFISLSNTLLTSVMRLCYYPVVVLFLSDDLSVRHRLFFLSTVAICGCPLLLCDTVETDDLSVRRGALDFYFFLSLPALCGRCAVPSAAARPLSSYTPNFHHRYSEVSPSLRFHSYEGVLKFCGWVLTNRRKCAILQTVEQEKQHDRG